MQARKIYTQVHVISKVVYAIIALFTVASILMLFQEVRQFGTSILASAGVVGIILGFAAQKTISNLFAGFQIAMTQPIRLDDVVIVEGEWGRVEEITPDLCDHPYLGRPAARRAAGLFHRETVPELDARLGSSCSARFSSGWITRCRWMKSARRSRKSSKPNPLWDKRFWNLQVTDATEKTMQIRVLATSADSSKAWNLRCDIREKLIAYIQKNHPQSLPQVRASFDRTPPGSPFKP